MMLSRKRSESFTASQNFCRNLSTQHGAIDGFTVLLSLNNRRGEEFSMIHHWLGEGGRLFDER